MILFHTLHIARPAWLLCLPFAWATCLYVFARNGQQATLKKICAPHLLPHLQVRINTTYAWTWPALWLVIATLFFTALSGPSLTRNLQRAYKAPIPRVVVLDLSENMLKTDISPQRLARAKYKLTDLTQLLQDAETGLVVFSGEPFLVSPLTDDAHTLSAVIPSLKPNLMPLRGHDIGAAMNFAARLLEQAHHKHGSLLLITASTPNEKDIQMAERLRSHHILTQVLAIGQQDLNHDALRRLAHSGGGQYQTLTADDHDLQTLLAAETHAANAHLNNKKVSRWADQGHRVLWLLLPFFALLFRRGWLEAIL